MGHLPLKLVQRTHQGQLLLLALFCNIDIRLVSIAFTKVYRVDEFV